MEDTREASLNGNMNIPELMERLDNDHELLRDLLGIFMEDFPLRLRTLQHAVAAHDLKRASSESHALKGMLANLAVTRAAAAAAHLEIVAHAGVQSLVDQALTAFQCEVQGLLPEMETYLSGGRG
jgi:HPt (histidine-containing phosphotransfer) domain-containing protein